MKLRGIQARKKTLLQLVRVAAAVVLLIASAGISAALDQRSFPSAEGAVNALMTAVGSQDEKEMTALFGPMGKDLLSSGDAVADRRRREEFLKKYEEKHHLSREGNNVVLTVGEDEWPFPVPIAKKGEAWVFDTSMGKEEILNRRIGENELNAIQVCLAIVDAQTEYAMKDHDRDGLMEYAEKIRSDPGKKNGLYWKDGEGEGASPLGPLAARARIEGYGKKLSGNPSPYHGYFYRILKAQGKNARGGAYDYLIKGNMIGGFAVVAYPAKYGNSGVMTFIVSHDGVVYQKNLGRETEKIADSMTKYDPDKTWERVKKQPPLSDSNEKYSR